MATGEDEVLRIADARYEALFGPLEAPARRVTRSLRARRSLGLARDLLEVRYQPWARTGSLRLIWTVDPASPVAPDRGWEIVSGPRPEAWGVQPQGELGQAWEETLEAALRASHPEVQARVWRWVEDPHGALQRRVEAQVWSRLPADTTRLRFEADGGRFVDWLHGPWFAPGGACPEEDRARQVVEAREELPEDFRFHESWPSHENPSHRELTWSRYAEGDLVEHDTAYASVRGGDLQIAQLLVVVSPLDPELDLSAEEGEAALADAFRAQFSKSVRCGRLRRVYVLLEGQPARRLAWVGNAIHEGLPIEVAVGSGGAVIRVQRPG